MSLVPELGSNEIWFYRIKNPKYKDVWFTPNTGYQIFDWAQEFNIKYKLIDNFGAVISVELLDDYSKMYFEFLWGKERYD